ncbi:MAG: tetratricopeptide repeat protein [Bdellovibrionaceae bacterium]|nr:tetratricopeptide repeat protein [Pseudobdellovibrionaceae bacterium]
MLVQASVNNRLLCAAAISVLFFASTVSAKTVGHVLKDIKKERASLPAQKAKKAQAAQRPAPVNLRMVRPVQTTTLTSQPGTSEAQFEKYLDQQIDQLYKLSEKTKSQRNRGDVWLRLAKAYTEKATLVEKRLNEQYDEQLKEYLANKRNKRPALNLAPSQAYNKKAIQLYQWYLKDNPKGANIDQVLFFLGYNSMALNQNALGIKYYEKLAKEHPKSEFLTEANLSLADHYFELATRKASKNRAEFLKAEKHYKEVLKVKTRLTPIATYKLAWVYFKLGQPKDALVYLSRLVKDSKSSDERMASAQRLAREAQKELPMFYSQVGDYTKSVDYFKALLPPNEVNKSLEDLAMLYSDSGNRAGANYLLDYLAKNAALSDEKTFEFQYKKFTLAESKSGIVNTRNEVFTMIQKFGPQSPWGKKNAQKAFYKNALQQMEFTLKSYTLAVHKMAQAKEDLYNMKKAEEAYKLYDHNFASFDKKGEMRFFYAELLYDMKDYYKAAELYSSIASKKTEYSTKAELNTLLSLEKLLPSTEQIKQQVGSSTEVLKLNPVEEKFRGHAENYLKNPKNTENRVEVMYKLASMLYAHNYLNEAEKHFKQVTTEFPKTQYAEYSTNLILDIYNLRQDYKGLEQAGLEILKSNATTNQNIAKDVKDVVEKSAFKNAESVEQKGQPLEAAKAYLEFYKKYPKSELSGLALYNAAINFEKGDKKLLALETYERFRQSVPKNDERSIESYLFTGIIKENLADFVGAVADYESYLAQVAPEKVNVDLYYNIGVIYEALRNFPKAHAFFNLYASQSKKDSNANLLFRIAELAEQLNLKADAIRNYERFRTTPGASEDLKIEALGRLAWLYRDTRQITKAKQAFDESIAIQNKLSVKKNAKYAAEGLFLATDSIYKELRDVKISADPAKQQVELQKKIKLVGDLQKATERVIALDAPEWIVAGLTRMAQGYQHLAYSLVTAPVPKDLNAEELKEYRSKIAEVAEPFKQNAIVGYEKALERAASLGGYGDFYSIARIELYSLAPEKTYYGQEDFFVMELYDNQMPRDQVYNRLVQADLDEGSLKKELAKILETDAKNITAHEYMAYYYYKNKAYQLAALHLDKINDVAKNNVRVLNNQGLIKAKLGNVDEAQNLYKRALDIQPDYEAANINTTKKYIEKNGFETPAPHLEILYGKTRSRMSKGDRMAIDIAVNHGIALARQGSYDGSVKIYSTVLKEEPGNVAAARNQAISVITGLKKKDQGAEVLQKYKSLASKKKDFDTIKLLEDVLKTL